MTRHLRTNVCLYHPSCLSYRLVARPSSPLSSPLYPLYLHLCAPLSDPPFCPLPFSLCSVCVLSIFSLLHAQRPAYAQKRPVYMTKETYTPRRRPTAGLDAAANTGALSAYLSVSVSLLSIYHLSVSHLSVYSRYLSLIYLSSMCLSLLYLSVMCLSLICLNGMCLSLICLSTNCLSLVCVHLSVSHLSVSHLSVSLVCVCVSSACVCGIAT